MSISWPCETMGVAPTVCNLGLLQFCCLLPWFWKTAYNTLIDEEKQNTRAGWDI